MADPAADANLLDRLAGEPGATNTVVATLTLGGGKTVSVTGTYDEATKTLSITGNGYTLTGTLTGSTLSGTYAASGDQISIRETGTSLEGCTSSQSGVYRMTFTPSCTIATLGLVSDACRLRGLLLGGLHASRHVFRLRGPLARVYRDGRQPQRRRDGRAAHRHRAAGLILPPGGVRQAPWRGLACRRPGARSRPTRRG